MAEVDSADLLKGLAVVPQQDFADLAAGGGVVEKETADIPALVVFHVEIEAIVRPHAIARVRLVDGDMDFFQDADLAANAPVRSLPRPQPGRRPARLAAVRHRWMVPHSGFSRRPRVGDCQQTHRRHRRDIDTAPVGRLASNLRMEEFAMDVTKKTAEFVAGAKYEAMPAKALENAKAAALDCVGVALAGSRDECAGIAAEIARCERAGEETSVWGQGFRSSALAAAFANGVAAHALDFDHSFTMMGQP